MKKEITITIPSDWSSISLKKYLQMQNELKNYSDDEEATTAIMLHHLCGLDVEYVNQIPMEVYETIKEDLGVFLNKSDYPLQQFVTIDGVEYGFEPNLSKMSYGAYLDITKYETITIDENWPIIMSILYRPITDKSFGKYDTKNYDGNFDKNKFLELGMDFHFGALFFFYNLLGDLLNDTLNSMKVPELPHNIKLILEKSGEITHRLLNLQTTISQK